MAIIERSLSAYGNWIAVSPFCFTNGKCPTCSIKRTVALFPLRSVNGAFAVFCVMKGDAQLLLK